MFPERVPGETAEKISGGVLGESSSGFFFGKKSQDIFREFMKNGMIGVTLEPFFKDFPGNFLNVKSLVKVLEKSFK